MKHLVAVSIALLAAAVPAAAATWPDYQIIEWQPRTQQQLAALKRIGVTGGMVFEPAKADALRASGMRYYIENIATDFYAAYHRWQPNQRIGARFAALQQRYSADPADLSVFLRDPSLSDPVWLQRIEDRLATVVHAAAPDHPLYYSLGDETGIAELAAPWDFDLSPAALDAFRTWLHAQYDTVAALNREWDTHYADWNEAKPELTEQAIARTGGDYASWSDFKAWMDVSFAESLRAGTDAVHRADPTALAAIEGAQVPGWGGYDYTLIAHAVDVVEIYPTYENLAILRSQNPAVVPLTTSFHADPGALHAIWQRWLEGCRGLILWDPKGRIVDADGALGPDGEAYAPVFAALRGPLGAAVLNASPIHGPIAVLYSPPSFRIHWLLEQRPDPTAWITRSLNDDDRGNAEREALASTGDALMHLGLSPVYVGPAQLGRGELSGARVLILPAAIALSDAEVEAVRRFVERGGVVLADAEPGLYDGHGKRRDRPPLMNLFDGRGAVILRIGDRDALQAALARVGVRASFTVSAPDTETYVFQNDAETVLGVQRDFAGDTGPEQAVVTLPRVFEVTDLRTGRSLGRLTKIPLTLDAVTPAVFGLTP
jgi:hypothetical protein